MEYADGETVLGYGQDNLLYKARIVKVVAEKKLFFVHFVGWSEKWDQWLREDRIMKVTKSNEAMAKQMYDDKVKKNGGKKGLRKPSSKRQKRETVENRGDEESDEEIDDDEEEEGPMIEMPGVLSAKLVSDWENINHRRKLIPLPCQMPVTKILEEYMQGEAKKAERKEAKKAEKEAKKAEKEAKQAEKEAKKAGKKKAGKKGAKKAGEKGAKKAGETVAKKAEEKEAKEAGGKECLPCPPPPQVVELVEGVKTLFNHYLAKCLLYVFERPQHAEITERKDLEKVDPCDIYGAEHLLRLFVKLPMVLKYSGISERDYKRLRPKLVAFLKWLAKSVTKAKNDFFAKSYVDTNPEYMKRLEALKNAPELDEPSEDSSTSSKTEEKSMTAK